MGDIMRTLKGMKTSRVHRWRNGCNWCQWYTGRSALPVVTGASYAPLFWSSVASRGSSFRRRQPRGMLNSLGGDNAWVEVMDVSPDYMVQQSSRREIRQIVAIHKRIRLHHTLETNGYWVQHIGDPYSTQHGVT